MSEKALGLLTEHLSWLSGKEMVLDPEAYGYQIWSNRRARYQWKVKGGRSSDDQGVAFLVSFDADIYLIRHNRVEVILKVRNVREDLEKMVQTNVRDLISPSFQSVFIELMSSYEGPR